MKVVFNGNLDTFNYKDFVVYPVSSEEEIDEESDLDEKKTINIKTLEVVDSKTIILTLTEKLPADVKDDKGDPYCLIAKGATSKNRYGITIKQWDCKEIADKISPSVDGDVTAEITTDGDKTISIITITFDEAINDKNVNETSFIVNDGKNKVIDIRVDKDDNDDNKLIIITVEGEVEAGDVVTQVTPLYDTADPEDILKCNKVVDIEVYIDKVVIESPSEG